MLNKLPPRSKGERTGRLVGWMLSLAITLAATLWAVISVFSVHISFGQGDLSRTAATDDEMSPQRDGLAQCRVLLGSTRSHVKARTALFETLLKNLDHLANSESTNEGALQATPSLEHQCGTSTKEQQELRRIHDRLIETRRELDNVVAHTKQRYNAFSRRHTVAIRQAGSALLMSKPVKSGAATFQKDVSNEDKISP